MAPKLSAEDKKWRGQDDAYTLSKVEEITSDKGRMVEAKKAAGIMLKEQEQKIAGLKKVIKKPAAPKKAAPKKAAPKKAAPKKAAPKKAAPKKAKKK